MTNTFKILCSVAATGTEHKKNGQIAIPLIAFQLSNDKEYLENLFIGAAEECGYSYQKDEYYLTFTPKK